LLSGVKYATTLKVSGERRELLQTMPTYEYECQVCGVHFERKQSVHDDPMQNCPDCGGKVRKLFFPAGIIFKGSGWYKTDNSSSGYAASKKEDSAPSPSKSEPAKAAPATSGPAKSEPTKSDASTSTAAKSEPAKSEPKKSETNSDK
jgi:putative FmdB family regulatory protein